MTLAERKSFLSPEREKDVRDYYTNLTLKMLTIGDPSLRQSTLEDQESIVRAREADNPKEGLRMLRQIIANDGSHSMLARTLAVISYYDIASTRNVDDTDFGAFFQEVVKRERDTGEPGSAEILVGAYYARFASKTMEQPEKGQAILKNLDTVILGRINSPLQEERKLGIHVAAHTIADLFDENGLIMQLPETLIHTGNESASKGVERTGGRPDKVMYLAPGWLPTYRKLAEGAVQGMPDISNKYPVRRIPRLLAGIEVDLHDREKREYENLEQVPDKKLIHIYMRALRKPLVPAYEAFRDERDYNIAKLSANCSFDNLSYILAVRLSRSLKRKLSGLDVDGEYNEEADHGRTRRDFIYSALNTEIQEIVRPVGVYSDGKEVSILSTALEESQKLDGVLGWGIQEAQEHLEYTVKALVLENNDGFLVIKDEKQIMELYRDHIWKKQLSREDKIALAMAFLRNPSPSQEKYFWPLVPRKFHNEIAKAANMQGELSPGASQMILDVMDIAKDNIFVLRCETIRDTYTPTPEETE